MSTFVYRQYKDSNQPLTGNSEGGETAANSASTTYPSDPVIIEPLQVKVFNGQLERAQRLFRTMVQRDGIIAAYKAHQSYEKPSVKRRRKRQEALQSIFETKMEEIRGPRKDRNKIKRRPVKREEDSALV